MDPTLEPDSTLRISINPNREGPGYIVTTAYLGWRFSTPAAPTRQALAEVVSASLDHVLVEEAAGGVGIALGPA